MNSFADLYNPPPTTFTANKKIATEPFKETAVKVVQKGEGQMKVGMIENTASLTALKVVFPTEDNRFCPGMTIYIRSNLYSSPWAKEVQEIDGKKFIIVPEDRVEVVVRGT